jgi:hypothetical protein
LERPGIFIRICASKAMTVRPFDGAYRPANRTLLTDARNSTLRARRGAAKRKR